MMTTVARDMANLCERQVRRLQGWADNLPTAPFEGPLLTAALALAGLSSGFLAAEIDVKASAIRAYVDDCSDALTASEKKALQRFFNRRGIYDVQLFSWFGWRGLIYAPWAAARVNAADLHDQARAARIIQFQREAGRRL